MVWLAVCVVWCGGACSMADVRVRCVCVCGLRVWAGDSGAEEEEEDEESGVYRSLRVTVLGGLMHALTYQWLKLCWLCVCVQVMVRVIVTQMARCLHRS